MIGPLRKYVVMWNIVDIIMRGGQPKTVKDIFLSAEVRVINISLIMCYLCIECTLACGRGDPHFTTLDGQRYTFNGLGEYVLLRESINDFEFQARTELAPNSNATIFSAFAIKDGSGVVEVT